MDPKALLDSLDVGVAVLARDWTVEDWSGAAARLTGLAPDRVVGQSFWHAFPAARDAHREDVRRGAQRRGAAHRAVPGALRRLPGRGVRHPRHAHHARP